MKRLVGKVALVTGGGQGIGEGIARALALEGAAVVITGRTESKLQIVRDELVGLGASVAISVGDVGQRADATRMVEKAVGEYGGLQILVNNAQSSVRRDLAETTDEDVELAYRSGALGTLYCMQAAFPHLRVAGGSIVNFGSNTAITGDASFGSYAMAKEAIRGLTRVASREWGGHGIRVNCICPTALSSGAKAFMEANPEQAAGYLGEISLGRFGDPEHDIGRAVVALASDDMGYLTGATLLLGGGRLVD
jgi:NAD(P)-dependent dehydrogenase (short-subunit alcohol dehydrogenase family)